jgi:hypothetical protein
MGTEVVVQDGEDGAKRAPKPDLASPSAERPRVVPVGTINIYATGGHSQSDAGYGPQRTESEELKAQSQRLRSTW